MPVHPQVDVRLNQTPQARRQGYTGHHHGRRLASSDTATRGGERGDETLGHGAGGSAYAANDQIGLSVR